MKDSKLSLILNGMMLIATLAGGSTARADSSRTVSVTGLCIRNVVPDRGSIILTSEARDADAKRAQQAANRIYEAVRSKVTQLRLPDSDVSTAEYVSEEVREWEKDRSVMKGYRTWISLRVESSDSSRLTEVMEIASREGIKQMSGLQLFVSSRKLLEEKTVCLKEAAQQAKTKADALAQALGAKVGEVQVISESGGTQTAPPMPMHRAEMSMMDSPQGGAAPRIEPGKAEISLTVQVTFNLK